MPTPTSRPATPPTNDQREFVHGMWRYCEIHRVPDMALDARPTALLRRGLVRVSTPAERALKPGRAGWKGNPARYALTDAGLAVALAEETARAARVAVNRANRGSNAMIGAGQ